MSTEQLVKTIRKQLEQIGRDSNRNMQSILLLYLQEKLLLRLSLSKYHSNFILKGGLLIYQDSGLKGRPTKDLDLLTLQFSAEPGMVEPIFQEICQIPVADGIQFDSSYLTSKPLRGNDARLRLSIPGSLGEMKAWVKIDLSFQGVVCQAPVDRDFPVLIEGHPHPKLKEYSLESSIAEKFEVMISRSETNSRTKDFYDIFSFASRNSFNGEVLFTIIRETFHQRKTPMEEVPALFTTDFVQDSRPAKDWESLLETREIEHIAFSTVMEKITAFLKPIYDSLYHKVGFHSNWNPATSQWVS